MNLLVPLKGETSRKPKKIELPTLVEELTLPFYITVRSRTLNEIDIEFIPECPSRQSNFTGPICGTGIQPSSLTVALSPYYPSPGINEIIQDAENLNCSNATPIGGLTYCFLSISNG